MIMLSIALLGALSLYMFPKYHNDYKDLGIKNPEAIIEVKNLRARSSFNFPDDNLHEEHIDSISVNKLVVNSKLVEKKNIEIEFSKED